MTKPLRLARILFALNLIALSTPADQVVMQNGDHYNGKVLSVSTTNVVLQSDVLGVVNLARTKVANVAMGSVVATNPAPLAVVTKTNAPTDFSVAMRQLGTQSNLLQQVRAQFLGGANPETNEKFNRMINDLTTGKMSVGDLRAEAKSAADQLRALEKEAGEDASGSMGLYLSILDSFLAETESTPGPMTNSAPTQAKP
jgi:hypothetical protein